MLELDDGHLPVHDMGGAPLCSRLSPLGPFSLLHTLSLPGLPFAASLLLDWLIHSRGFLKPAPRTHAAMFSLENARHPCWKPVLRSQPRT